MSSTGARVVDQTQWVAWVDNLPWFHQHLFKVHVGSQPARGHFSFLSKAIIHVAIPIQIHHDLLLASFHDFRAQCLNLNELPHTAIPAGRTIRRDLTAHSLPDDGPGCGPGFLPANRAHNLVAPPRCPQINAPVPSAPFGIAKRRRHNIPFPNFVIHRPSAERVLRDIDAYIGTMTSHWRNPTVSPPPQSPQTFRLPNDPGLEAGQLGVHQPQRKATHQEHDDEEQSANATAPFPHRLPSFMAPGWALAAAEYGRLRPCPTVAPTVVAR